MKTIYKYPLKETDIQTIRMPIASEVLTVKLVDNQLFMWAEVDNENQLAEYEFSIIGTGHYIKDAHKWKYVETIIKGEFVLHIYTKIFYNV